MKLLSNAQIQAEKEAEKRAKQTKIDTTKLALLYCRQSTKEQIVKNKESALSQTVGAKKRAVHEHGFGEEKLVLFIENELDQYGNKLAKWRAASGRLDKNFRAGLREAERLIEQDRVGAVFVDDVSRLFRDEDMVDPTNFANTCKKHHCVVVTEDREFDFNATARDDLKDFLEEAQEAADYLKFLRRTLHRRKEKKGKRGEYIGGAIPVGLMLDEERKWYIPNPYWCDTVSWLTRRFRELEADLTALCNEIRGVAIFDELPEDEEFRKRVGQIQLRKVQGGYTVASRASLVGMLTNPANIGVRVYKGKIVPGVTHTAIVDRDDFNFALSHLGAINLDGNEIEREKRAKRFTQAGTKREGLLAGVRNDGRPVVTSTQGNVYVFQNTAYTIKNYHDLSHSPYIASIALETVDTAVSTILEEKLRTLVFHAEVEKDLGGEPQHGAQAILNHVAALRQQVIASLAKIDESCKSIEREIARKQRDYDAASDVMSREDIREHYASLARLRTRLDDLHEKQAQAKETDQETIAVSNKLQRARDEWGEMDLEEKRSFIRIITLGISLDELSDRFMKLTIEWSPILSGKEYIEYILFLRVNGASNYWSDEEVAILRDMYPESPKSAILSALPNRSWDAIRLKARGMERYSREAGTIPASLSLKDYAIMQEHTV